jgi:hypothetical protein
MFGVNNQNQPGAPMPPADPTQNQMSGPMVPPPGVMPGSPVTPAATPLMPPLGPEPPVPTAVPPVPTAVAPLAPSAPMPGLPTAEVEKAIDNLTVQAATVPAAPAPTGDTAADDLLSLKHQALQTLAPLVGHIDQTPEEKFKTTMMMIQATDNSALLREAYEVANKIPDEKTRAQALLDVVNEINYFTQHGQAEGQVPPAGSVPAETEGL